MLNLLGQHFTTNFKSLVQCCPRDSRQQRTGKSPVQCCLNTLGQHCTGKNLVQCCPRDSRQHCTGKKPSAMSSENHFSAIFNFDQHCTNFSNIAQEKSRANIEQKEQYGTISKKCDIKIEK